MADRQSLEQLLEEIEGTTITVVGDLILDHYIWGKVERISPEAPVVVVDASKEDRRLGGAGNVVRNLREIGANVSVCGVVGDDADGRTLLSMLEESGADIGSVLVDRSRRTTVKTRVIAHAQQVVRVDKEDRGPLDQPYADGIAGALESKFAASEGVILSDYGKGAICPAIFERVLKLKLAGKAGLGKNPLVVDPKAPNFGMYSGVTVIKPNRAEAEEASGIAIRDRASAIAAGRKLLETWDCELLLVTLGEMGMILVGAGEPVEIDTVAREVFDVSGAGDTVSAVFTAGLAAGAAPELAAELANLAAGVVVSEIGTVPIKKSELQEAIGRT